jgi:hypothetical protein
MVEEPIELLGMDGAGGKVVGGFHERDKILFIDVLLVAVGVPLGRTLQRVQKMAASMTTRPRSSPSWGGRPGGPGRSRRPDRGDALSIKAESRDDRSGSDRYAWP